jgi:hypothetical protein
VIPVKQAWTFLRELDGEAIACHGKGEGVVREKAPLNDETLLAQCNATFEALSVVLRSGVGDHRALGTWHASRIMLMIPDTYLRSFSSSWDEGISGAKKIHTRLRNCLKMSRLGLIFHGVSDGR